MARALIFAHHDPDGLFDPAVIHALKAYRRVADHLTVVSTAAAGVPPPVSACIDRFLPRENIGYDFCSWRAGIEAIGDLGDFDEIVCANDSVYGPLFELGPAFTDPRVSTADFWGMCLSGQDPSLPGRGFSPHLQSWFFVMRRPLVASKVFAEFWGSVVPLSTKREIVVRYELGMSRRFAEAGFVAAALFDATRTRSPTPWKLRRHLSPWEPGRSWRLLWKSARRFPNPSELCWEDLIETGVPFVKASLFRVNHYGLDLERVTERLERLGSFDVGMIRNHLRRVGGREHRPADLSSFRPAEPPAFH